MKIQHLFLFFTLLLTCGCRAIPFGSGQEATPTPSLLKPTETAIPDSGIEGVVMLGPTCGGPVRIDATACADQPYQATITVLNASREQVSQFQSDSDGHFRVALAPGKYILHPEMPSAMPTAAEMDVEVYAGKYSEVVIHYDTGLR